MPAAAWVTLAITALIILAAALGLLRVIFHLKTVRQTLGTVIVGVSVVAHQTRTVPEVLPSVNANLKPVRDFCESI
jgi:multisubunit Na+/H+ antiporter MnhG subunit